MLLACVQVFLCTLLVECEHRVVLHGDGLEEVGLWYVLTRERRMKKHHPQLFLRRGFSRYRLRTFSGFERLGRLRHCQAIEPQQGVQMAHEVVQVVGRQALHQGQRAQHQLVGVERAGVGRAVG